MIAGAAAIYRTLIRLYPHAFWREFHDELEDDFGEGSREALAAGVVALARFWMRVAADLVASLVCEWLRTPWLPVLLIAGTVSFAMFVFTAEQVLRLRIPVPARPSGERNAEGLKLIVVLTVGALIPIVCAILASAWPLLLRRRPPRRRRHV